MREHFRLSAAVGELVAQIFGDATMQSLTAALQQVLVSRVLDQRVLEAIFASGGSPSPAGFGLGEFSSALQRRILHAGDPEQQRIGEAAPEHRPIATSRAGPSRSSRAVSDCCKVGGIAWAPPCSPRSKQQPRNFLHEQRHAAGAL